RLYRLEAGGALPESPVETSCVTAGSCRVSSELVRSGPVQTRRFHRRIEEHGWTILDPLFSPVAGSARHDPWQVPAIDLLGREELLGDDVLPLVLTWPTAVSTPGIGTGSFH